MPVGRTGFEGGRAAGRTVSRVEPVAEDAVTTG